MRIPYRSFLLGHGRNLATNDLESQLRQIEIASKFGERPLAIVVDVEQACDFVGKDEVTLRSKRRLRLVLRRGFLRTFFALKVPRLQIVGELSLDTLIVTGRPNHSGGALGCYGFVPYLTSEFRKWKTSGRMLRNTKGTDDIVNGLRLKG